MDGLQQMTSRTDTFSLVQYMVDSSNSFNLNILTLLDDTGVALTSSLLLVKEKGVVMKYCEGSEGKSCRNDE